MLGWEAGEAAGRWGKDWEEGREGSGRRGGGFQPLGEEFSCWERPARGVCPLPGSFRVWDMPPTGCNFLIA